MRSQLRLYIHDIIHKGKNHCRSMCVGISRFLHPQGTLRRNSIQFIHFQAFHSHSR